MRPGVLLTIVLLMISLALPAAAQTDADDGAWTRHETTSQLISLQAPSDWTITLIDGMAVELVSPDGSRDLGFNGVLMDGGMSVDEFLAQSCDPASFAGEGVTVLSAEQAELPVGGTTCRAVLSFTQGDNTAVGVFYFILYGGGEIVLSISGSGDAPDEETAAEVIDLIDHAAATFDVTPDLNESTWTRVASAGNAFSYALPPGWEALEATVEGSLTAAEFEQGLSVTVSAIPLDNPLDIARVVPDVQASYEGQGGTVETIALVNRGFGDAVRLTGSIPALNPDDGPNAQLQYVFVRGDTLYFMTATAPEALSDALERVFEQIFATFALP
jgi:hypothetical protein